MVAWQRSPLQVQYDIDRVGAIYRKFWQEREDGVKCVLRESFSACFIVCRNFGDKGKEKSYPE